VGKGFGKLNRVQILCTRVRNGKMIPVESIARMRREKIKENDQVLYIV
jgi:hypothetical protein